MSHALQAGLKATLLPRYLEVTDVNAVSVQTFKL
jgi:hypothetical protein